MILLTEDVFKYAKRKYAKHCITTILLCCCIYKLSVKLNNQEKEINDLIEKFEALKMKGD